MTKVAWNCNLCWNVVITDFYFTSISGPSNLKHMGGPCPSNCSYHGEHAYYYDVTLTEKLLK